MSNIPDPPNSVSVTNTTSNSISLQIIAPISNILTSYYSSPINLTGLNESLTYNLDLISVFTNTVSEISSFSITTYPSLPTDVSNTVIDSSTAIIQFTTSYDKVYDISAVPTAGSISSAVGLTSSPYTLNGLITGMNYNVRIFSRSNTTGLKTKTGTLTTLLTKAKLYVAAGTVSDVSAVITYVNNDGILTYTGTFTRIDVSYARVGDSTYYSYSSTSASSLVITGLSESTAYNMYFISTFQNTRSDMKTLQIITYPSVPSGLTKTVISSTSLIFQYTSNVSLSYVYDISCVRTTAQSTVDFSANTINNTSQIITGLIPSTSYTIYLFARSLYSLKSNPGSIIAFTYTVAPSVISTVYDTSASFTFNYIVGSDAGTFNKIRIYYTNKTTNTSLDISSSSNSGPISLLGLTENTRYDISYVAFYSNTNSDMSYISIITYPTPPSDITVTKVTSTTANVSFTVNATYTYDISAVPTSGTTISATNITIPYTLTGLTIDSIYTIYVFAISPQPNNLKYSRSVTYYTFDLSGPTNITSEITSTTAVLSYSLYTNASLDQITSVDITYKQRGGTATTVRNSTSPYNTYTLTGLSPTYTYDLSLVTNYNTIKSLPSNYTFTTLVDISNSYFLLPSQSAYTNYKDISGWITDLSTGYTFGISNVTNTTWCSAPEPSGITQFLYAQVNSSINGMYTGTNTGSKNRLSIKQYITLDAKSYTLSFYRSARSTYYIDKYVLSVRIGTTYLFRDISASTVKWDYSSNSFTIATPGTYDLVFDFSCNVTPTDYAYTIAGIDIAVNNYPFDSLSSTSKNALVGAYSLFKLNSSYNGPTVRIRRSSDNVKSFFYSSINGTLGTNSFGTGTSLTNWLNGSIGYIDTWYDQSGKGNNATQTTTGSQPFININGKYIDFSGNLYFTLPNGTVPSVNSSYTVTYKHGAITNDRGGILGSGNYGSTNQVLAFRTNTSTYAYSHYWWVTDFSFNGYAANNMVTETYESTTRNRNAYINKNFITSSTPGSNRNSGTGNNTIGVTYNTEYLNGPLYFLYIFNIALDASNRAIVESTNF